MFQPFSFLSRVIRRCRMGVSWRLERFRARFCFAEMQEVEQAEQAFYVQYLRDGMMAFDVGANIGQMTLLFSKIVGANGQVHSFEACKNTFDILKSNCETAGCTNAMLNHLALAEKDGIAKLYVYDREHAGWNTVAQRPLENYGVHVKSVGTEEVQTTTVDAYCELKRIESIDLLKIDVEGAEMQVLLGAKKMLGAQKIRCCVFEFGQTTFDAGNNPDAIESLFDQFGYYVRNVVKRDPVFPGRTSVRTARFSVHVAMLK